MSLKVRGFTILVFAAYLASVWCEETQVSTEGGDASLVETGRRRRFHGIGHRWWGIYGLHALAVFYWLKVKAVIVTFLVGSALVWGFRYLKTNRGCSEIIHESPVIEYDHGPAWSGGPHDHIPYSLDHNPFEHDHHHHHDHFSSSDIVGDSFPAHEPYSAYSESYGQVDPTVATAPAGPAGERRSRQMESEEQVSEIVFGFLGVNDDACRRRFICEMEFRAKESPITRMAFGIVGRGLFSKYVNAKNSNGRATSFSECAAVNPGCSFIEENTNNNSENEVVDETTNEARSLADQGPRDLEKENQANLKAENESSQQQTPTPPTADPIARAIFTRSQASNNN